MSVLPVYRGDRVVVANDGAYDYLVRQRNYDSIRDLAQKCIGRGVVARVMRPFNTLKLNRTVQAADTPELYDAEYEAVELGEYPFESPPIETGTRLAQLIVREFEQVDKSGEEI